MQLRLRLLTPPARFRQTLLYRIARILLITAAGSYLLCCALLYFAQGQMIFHASPLPSDFNYGFHQPYQEVFIPVEGARLAAIHFTRAQAKGIVLYLHGNASSLAHAEWMADPFLSNGYEAFLIDYRGYGKSSGTIGGEDQLHADVRAAYSYLLRSYREDQIIIYGQSIGTGLTVRLASETSPRMLILEASYFSMRDLVGQIVPYLPIQLLRYSLRSDQWIGAVRCPIYMFHGTSDPLIPYDSSVRLAALAKAPHQLFLVPGAQHANIPTFPMYHEQMQRILQS